MYNDSPMYFVTRFNMVAGGTESHSVQMYETETAAKKRFYNILAADIDNTNLLYEMVNVVDFRGIVIAVQVFDNRPAEVIPDD